MGTLCPSLPHRSSWPVGFRFHPTDEELINHYLKNKILARESHVRYIREVDICKYDPWELPRLSNDESGDQEWFFFCAQDFKYSNGRRANRATASGFWKSTGKDRKITEGGTNKLIIGTKKTLVFYKGRVPNGVRTNWVIHEYRPKLGFADAKSFVICRLKKKVADENENAALTCDEAGFVNSNFENVTPIQEISEEYGQSLYLPDLQPSDYELYSPMYSDQEPTCMDFQASNDFGSPVSDLPLQFASAPAPAEEDFDVNEFVDSILVDDGIYFDDEELLRLVSQNHRGADAAFGWQNDDVSQNLFREHSSSRLQSKSTIKESRRSPLSSKLLKYREEDLSSVHSHVDVPSINCITYPSDTDDSDENIKTFRSQRQPRSKSNKLVAHVDATKIVRSKSVAQREAISHHKENAAAKQTKVVRLPKPSIDDSKEDQKSEASKCCRGESFESGRKGSSMILTTKCIHHKSNPASVYVGKACIGFILFVIVVREVLLYGNLW